MKLEHWVTVYKLFSIVKMKVSLRALGLLFCSTALLILTVSLLDKVRTRDDKFPLPMSDSELKQHNALVEIPGLKLNTDEINYKNGFIAESSCCKGLPKSIISRIVQPEWGPDVDQSVKTKSSAEPGCSFNDIFLCRLVVVTGFSSNHFNEAQDMIASVQHNLPNTKLIVYDLGLSTEERNSIQSFCNVEYRLFNFSRYPKHTKFFKNYSFKPLIIQEISNEYEVVMWCDASVRIMSPNLESTLFPYFQRFPFIPGCPSGQPAVALTHPGMMNYLNVTETWQQLNPIYNITIQANGWIMWINKFMREEFLDVWVDCALNIDCIAPKGSRLWPCKFSQPYYYECHRYDQSAMNLILIKILKKLDMNVTDSIYHYPFNTVFCKVFSLERHVTSHFTPAKKCVT